MKTKTFLLLCLFMGIGLTKLSAQPAIGKSGNLVYDDTYYLGYKVPLNCNINTPGFLYGTLRYHTVIHYSNYDGDWLNYDWIRQKFHGDLVLEGSKEVFKVSDIFTAEGPNYTLPATGHFNIIGNQGSHYIVTYLWDDWEDPANITFVSVKCPGGK